MMVTTRRNFLAAGFSMLPCTALADLPVPVSDTLSFRIMRKGSRIGTHKLSFARIADALTVTIAVEMAVSFSFIRLFHYKHNNIERWSNGAFAGMDAKTDYDGEPAWCTVRRAGDGLITEGSKAARYVAPQNAMAATHWNKAELQGPMINPENGMLMRPAITDVGRASVTLASGATEPARQYAWRGRDSLDLWYDARGDWAALRAVTPGGEILTYEKL